MTSRRGLALWGCVLTDGHELAPSRVEVVAGRIVNVEPTELPRAGDLVVESGWIAPGLIDLQVNGAGGVDLTSAADTASALTRVGRTLAKHGVTAFCPTIVSSPVEVITRCLRAYRPQTVDGGAESLGIHIEGPFIAPDHRGIHEADRLRLASHEEISQWLDAGTPAIVTLAPERSGGLAAIAQLTRSRVVVSLGHSGADTATARLALDAGARMATHLFNAMPPLHHRRPGLVGAVLANSAAVLGLIADGVHLDPLVIDLVVRRCGVLRVVLVSDALSSAGAPPGEYLLGDQTVISDGRVVRRKDGTLAGSAMLLADCLRNVRAWLPDLPPGAVMDMATRSPAGLLGLEHKGRVAVGYDADLIVVDPQFNVKLTITRGGCEPD